MAGKNKDSHWIPLADLMTALMVIFLFIAVAYMHEANKQKKQQEKIINNYKEDKVKLYNELKEAFKKDFKRWDLRLDNDLSIKFTNPQVLFGTGSSDITPHFQAILVEFIPKYLNVVLQEKYTGKIAEIRIEGHTDTQPVFLNGDPYIDNMKLSQDRCRNVLAFLRSQNCFKDLNSSRKDRLQFWLTANGLSYGRTLDQDYKNTFDTQKEIDNNKSRRVEFRIVTKSEAVINEALKNIEKQ
jgi:outer membrane protein OmpA-like peptidoglycan-associated protein